MSRPRQKVWDAPARAAASAAAKARWAALSPETKERRMRKGRAAYAAKYPERVALSERVREEIRLGRLEPGPCRDCGGSDAAPEFDYERLELSGWSHYDCRKARQ